MQHFIYFFVLIFVLVGCSNFENENEEVVLVNTFRSYLSESSTYEFFRDKVITIGDHHFIPLQVSGKPIEYPQQILSLLELFEKVYPDLQVTSWSIEKQQEGYLTSARIYGIWVDTEPRLK